MLLFSVNCCGLDFDCYGCDVWVVGWFTCCVVFGCVLVY